jgi:predicted metalloprotease with PDZ domain
LRILLAVVFSVLITASAVAGELSPVSYTLRPAMKDGALRAVAVEIDLTADPSGRTEFALPDHYAGQKQLWTAMRHLSVSGGHARLVANSNPAIAIVRSDPGARITLAYDIVQGFKGVPGQDSATYYRPVIQPGYFHLLGITVFVTPKGSDKRAASFRADGIPKGWSFASTLERENLTIFDMKLSVTVGGDFRIVQVPAGQLRLAIRGHWTFGDADFARRVARICDAELRFWGDPASPYLVTVLPLQSDGLTASTGGTGEAGGFAMYLSPQSDDTHIEYGFAHERLHAWISSALGNSGNDTGPSESWLAEGFTDYFARRILLATGVWPLPTTLYELNQTLLNYDTSPVRDASNARVAKEMFSNPDIQQLPYWRGALMAMRWDARLRRTGSGMDDIVRQMRALATAHPNKTPTGNLIDAMKFHGLDVRGDIARHIGRGEPIWLDADTFAPCAAVATTDIAAFDAGFDAQTTSQKGGVVTGIDPKGAAYAAGLRDGMKLIKRLSPYSIDSRRPRIYSVLDHGRLRTISYLPAARTRVRVQTLTLDPLARADACARVLAATVSQ